jgi:hypothetical protein
VTTRHRLQRRPDEDREASGTAHEAAVADPPLPAPEQPLTASALMQLQSRAGNAAVARLLAREPTATAEPDAAKRQRGAATRPADRALTDTSASKTGNVSNAYGTFKYSVLKNAGSNGCDFSLSFEAFSPEVSATKVTFIQTVQGHKAAGAAFYLNNDSTYYAPFDPDGTGLYTDHLKGETDPFYNYEDKSSTDETTGTTGPTKTTMTDAPAIRSIAGERGQKFETAPFALSGTDKGEFFGTFTWGWDIDAAGNFKLLDIAAHDEITTSFGAALRKFIARQNDLTKTGTTPASTNLDTLPSDKCRDLRPDEQLKLKPIGDYAKAKAGTRVWVVSRYGDAADRTGAKYNAEVVQAELVSMGVPIDHIRITYLEQSGVTKRTTPIEITVIES